MRICMQGLIDFQIDHNFAVNFQLGQMLKFHSIGRICKSIRESWFHNVFGLYWQCVRIHKYTINWHQICTCVLTASAILQTVQIQCEFINTRMCKFGRKCANLKFASNLHTHLLIRKFSFSSRGS